MSENGHEDPNEIFIDGSGYNVPKPVADEVVRLRMEAVQAVLERMKAIEPSEGETVVIYVPSKASQEFMVQCGDLAKMQFPNNRIAVLPETLQLHTSEGLAEVISEAMALTDAVERDEGVHLDTKAAALSLKNRLLSRQNGEDEEE